MAGQGKSYPNSGVLFRNDRKTEANHPDYNGSGRITINGQEHEFWISAWLKESQKGKFFSFAFKPKEQQQQPRQQTSYSAPEPSNDVPF